MKCTRYGICNKLVFKNARAMVFSKSGGAGSSFQSGSKISKNIMQGFPSPDLTPSESSWRGVQRPPQEIDAGINNE